MKVLLPVRLAKELRELAPWWAATVFTMLACHAVNLVTAACLIYMAGAVALGAVSIGHEYTHRTLTTLLAQPIDRQRLLATKLAALIPMLAALALVAAVTVGTDRRFSTATPGVDASLYWAFLIAPPAIGLFLAPWLTMAARGPLPGIVFSIAIPGFLLVLGGVAAYVWPAMLWKNVAGRFSREFPWSFVWPALSALCAVGAIFTRRTFLRLETVEGQSKEIDLAGWVRHPLAANEVPTRSRNRVWLLFLKELRLQQMTFVIAGLYAALWLASVAARRWTLSAPDPEAISTLHAGLVSVVAGALASAEERHLAMADWHQLLPTPPWMQWTIKAGTAMAVAMVLAIGLPTLLSAAVSVPQDVDLQSSAAVILLCLGALYVSSLSGSGIRALMASFPALAAGGFVGGTVLYNVTIRSARAFLPIAKRITPFSFGPDDYGNLLFQWMPFLSIAPMALGLAVLLWRFGAANHRSADRNFARVWPQVAWMTGFAVCASFIVTFAQQIVWAGFRRW